MKKGAYTIPVVSCADCIHHQQTDHPAVSYCAKIKMHQANVKTRTCMVKERKK